jgi:hypothetical protein
MSSPEKMWNESPLKKFAEDSLNKPGMYLIALRTHLSKGKTILGDMINSVADAIPQPGKARSSSEE